VKHRLDFYTKEQYIQLIITPPPLSTETHEKNKNNHNYSEDCMGIVGVEHHNRASWGGAAKLTSLGNGLGRLHWIIIG
jgi:hypothetical protein